VECAPGHRNIHRQPPALNRAGVKINRKTRRHAFVLTPVFLDSFVFDAPLKKLETVAAKLAPEGIDIEKTYQALAETDPADALNVFSGTSRTKRPWHRIFSPRFLQTRSINQG
jgi:hypothetical protein